MQLIQLALLISSLLIQDASASPAPPQVVEKRSGCNQDNLLNNLEASAHLADSYRYCSALLSIPATSTVKKYTSTCVLSTYEEVSTIVHPLYLYNLQHLTATTTPISYNQASPTPSTIPGGAQTFGWPYYKRDIPQTQVPDDSPTPTASPDFPQELVRRGGASPPSWLPTTYPVSRLSSACSCLSVPAAATTTTSLKLFSIQTTSTCTNYIPTTVATYAAICAPSLQANAPQPNSHANYVVTPSFPVASKMDCCAACTNVFNCVWWKFDFGTVGDGWRPGTCHYAYFTGAAGDSGIAICPNGGTQAIPYLSSQQFGREANNNDPGYNFGPCGGAFNVFESNEDSGYPDNVYDCYGSPPTYNPPGCGS